MQRRASWHLSWSGRRFSHRRRSMNASARRFFQAGDAAANRFVQVSRRFQQAVSDPASRAHGWRGGILVRQSCTGCCRCGPDIGDAGHHRDAGRCAGVKARAHQGLRSGTSYSTTATTRIARRSHARSPASAAPRWCRLMTIPKSLPGKAPWVARLPRISPRFGYHQISGRTRIRRRLDRGDRDGSEGEVSGGDGDVRRTGRVRRSRALIAGRTSAKRMMRRAAPSAIR